MPASQCAHEAAGGGDALQRHAEGCCFRNAVTPAAWREAGAHLCAAHGVSERRACFVLRADRAWVRYRPWRPDDDEFRERLRALSRERQVVENVQLLLLLTVLSVTNV